MASHIHIPITKDSTYIELFTPTAPKNVAEGQMTPEVSLGLLEAGSFTNATLAASLAPTDQSQTPWLSCAIAVGISDGNVTVPDPAVKEVVRKVLAQRHVAGAGAPCMPLCHSFMVLKLRAKMWERTAYVVDMPFGGGTVHTYKDIAVLKKQQGLIQPVVSC